MKHSHVSYFCLLPFVPLTLKPLKTRSNPFYLKNHLVPNTWMSVIKLIIKAKFAGCCEINIKCINIPHGQNLKCWGTLAKLWKATSSFLISVCPSVRPSVHPHGTSWLSWKLILEYFSRIYEKNQFHENLTRITDTLHEYLCTVMMNSS